MAFNVLMDLTCVDYLTFEQSLQSAPTLRTPTPLPYFMTPKPSTETWNRQVGEANRFEVVYHFYSLAHNHRLRLKVPLTAEDPTVASVKVTPEDVGAILAKIPTLSEEDKAFLFGTAESPGILLRLPPQEQALRDQLALLRLDPGKWLLIAPAGSANAEFLKQFFPNVDFSKFDPSLAGNPLPPDVVAELDKLLQAFAACLDAVNLERPDLVLAIHLKYIAAGAEVVETNSFGANRVRLAEHGLAERLAEINGRAVKLAREAREISGKASTACAIFRRSSSSRTS
jgi:hypothetical protein